MEWRSRREEWGEEKFTFPRPILLAGFAGSRLQLHRPCLSSEPARRLTGHRIFTLQDYEPVPLYLLVRNGWKDTIYRFEFRNSFFCWYLFYSCALYVDLPLITGAGPCSTSLFLVVVVRAGSAMDIPNNVHKLSSTVLQYMVLPWRYFLIVLNFKENSIMANIEQSSQTVEHLDL